MIRGRSELLRHRVNPLITASDDRAAQASSARILGTERVRPTAPLVGGHDPLRSPASVEQRFAEVEMSAIDPRLLQRQATRVGTRLYAIDSLPLTLRKRGFDLRRSHSAVDSERRRGARTARWQCQPVRSLRGPGERRNPVRTIRDFRNWSRHFHHHRSDRTVTTYTTATYGYV